MAGSSLSKRYNPFVGPRPFESGERLYGRDDEIRELGYLLNAQRIVVLCSPSGAGKSSLIQAGLLPGLKERFDVWGPTRLGLESTEKEANRYVLSALQGFEEEIPEDFRRPPKDLMSQSLEGYIKKRPRRRPVEERDVLLVFEQFEEIFTVEPLQIEARRVFFDQLAEALCDPNLWALFVLREDYLALLDSYANQIPTQFRHRFRIDLLDREAAKAAIINPVRAHGREFLAADDLVGDLASCKAQQVDGSFREEVGIYVEPVYLQVVCRRLWERMPQNVLRIDREILKELGDVNDVLAGYYRDSVNAVAGGNISRERSIRYWFQSKLILAERIRTRVLRGVETSGDLSNELVEDLLESHLIRKERHSGASWYELAHDRLIDPILEDNAAWRKENPSEFEKRAKVWLDQEKRKEFLLKDEELPEAERWAREFSGGLTEGEKAFLESSKKVKEFEKTKARLWRRAYPISLAALTTYFSLWGMWEARRKNESQDFSRTALSARWLFDGNIIPGNLIMLEIRRPYDTPSAIATLYRSLADPIELAILHGHTGAIRAISVSPDGLYVATASADDTVRIWSTASGKEVSVFRGHPVGDETEVVDVAISPDGVHVVSVCEDYTKRHENSPPPDNTARIWDLYTGAEVTSLEGHASNIIIASFNYDGTRVVTASRDGTARIWEPFTGEEIAVLKGHTASVVAASFSPDGTRVVTASEDDTARIWDSVTGEETNILKGHTATVLAASFSPDSSRVVTASGDHTARVWDPISGQETAVLQGHSAPVWTAAFSPDGSRVVTASDDRTARIWEVYTGRVGVTLQGHTGTVWAASLSPDGTRVLTASEDGTARIWNARDGREIAVLQGHLSGLTAASFTPDGRLVVTASTDRTARIWNLATSEEIATLQGHSSAVVAASFGPSGTGLVTASWDDTARLWNTSTGEETATLRGHISDVWGASFSPDGTRVVTASQDTTARIWNSETGEEMAILQGHTGAVVAASFNPGGYRVVTASQDDTARIWNASTGEEAVTLRGHTADVWAASFGPDGTRIVTASWDRTARIWNSGTGEEIATLEGHTGPLWTASFNPNGQRVVTASQDATARIWSSETGEEIVKLEGHSAPVVAASFSPDGSRVVTASDDATARIWNVTTGEEIAVLQGHASDVRVASFSPDGSRVVTASGDRTARIWNSNTGEEIAVFRKHTDAVSTASFSPDGYRVVTASMDGQARIWASGTELLQSRIRWRTRLCLDPNFRQRTLDESPKDAERRSMACERCVPGFFDHIGDAPPGDWKTYVEAWRLYRECLDD